MSECDWVVYLVVSACSIAVGFIIFLIGFEAGSFIECRAKRREKQERLPKAITGKGGIKEEEGVP